MFAPALVQIVTGLASFYGVKRLCADPVLATGGDLWFLDLTVPDPTYMLAIGTATSMMISIYVGGDTDLPNEDAATANRMKAFGLGFGVLIVPFSMFLPSGVIVYIGATSVTMMLQTLFLKVSLLIVVTYVLLNGLDPARGESYDHQQVTTACWRNRLSYYPCNEIFRVHLEPVEEETGTEEC